MQPYYSQDGIEIYHGDSSIILPWLKERCIFDLVLSDPPYGDNHDTDYTRFSGGANAERGIYKPIANDEKSFDAAPILTLNTETILFGANRYSDQLPCGSWLIWDKRTPAGSKNVMSDAEVAWWSKGRGVYVFNHMWDGFNRASERGVKLHPTQKPVALMQWCIQKTRLKPGSLIIDPYMGSGPALRAAKDLGMRAIGIELEERYCEAAANRLMQSVMELV